MRVILMLFLLSAWPVVGGQAAERQGKFEIDPGIGFALDSSGKITFSFGVTPVYHLTENVGVGGFFDLYAGDGITSWGDTDCSLIPCTSTRFNKVTMDTGGQVRFTNGPADGFEVFASLGAGYIHTWGGGSGMAFPIGLGAFLTGAIWETGDFGFGTTMVFEPTTLSDANFIWNWLILTLQGRF